MKIQMPTPISNFVRTNHLPDRYLQTINCYLRPLSLKIITKFKDQITAGLPPIIGISAPQGSGKTTLTRCLALLLEEASFQSEIISIDDFYLTKNERIALGRKIHPLLTTRGVPGTHDLDLLHNSLIRLRKRKKISLPHFDKLKDDRSGRRRSKKPDFILLEGWCLGWPQTHFKPRSYPSAFNLEQPINRLEEEEDPNRIWRHHIHQQAPRYQTISDHIDYLIYLQIPNFSLVYQWRMQQELALAKNKPNQIPMNKEELNRFVQHYERVTRQLMCLMPGKADAVLKINLEHHFTELIYQDSST